jgi:hypothetical protein
VSPVSRGRSGKKKKKRAGSGNHPPVGRGAVQRLGQTEPAAADQPWTAGSLTGSLAEAFRSLPGAAGIIERSRIWWPESREAIFAESDRLLSSCDPVALEDAVCDLLGRHWAIAFEKHDVGLSLDEWLGELIDEAETQAGRPGVRHLLHGIAAIASPGLAGAARQVLKVTAPPAEPEWLANTSKVVASPGIMVLSDAYGLRFGVLIEMTGPARSVRTYLLDVDLCHGFAAVLTAGYHPDAAAGAQSWRGLVGPSADGIRPEPATSQLLATVLPGGGVFDRLTMHPLTSEHFTECYRADRVVHAAADALDRARRPISWRRETVKEREARVEPVVREFQSWLTTTGREQSDDPELIESLLETWFVGLPEPMCFGCSPHRIAAFTAYLNDDWLEEYRQGALALLEPWVEYCIKRTGGLPDRLAQLSLATARHAVRSPEAVGGDLGNRLNRPMREIDPQILDLDLTGG